MGVGWLCRAEGWGVGLGLEGGRAGGLLVPLSLLNTGPQKSE